LFLNINPCIQEQCVDRKLEKMKKNLILFGSFILLTLLTVTAKAQEMDPLLQAKEYFRQLDSICSADNGLLWGVNLYGPVMLVSPADRVIIANRQNKSNTLVEKEGVFIGRLPDNTGIANTAFEWDGELWTMAMWNALSPDDNNARNRLLVHECWHAKQQSVGIMPVMTQNTHLDQEEGNILMRLELMALSRALQAVDLQEIKSYTTDALLLRHYRQALFPNNNENEFERHEGMAEYTGYRLCGMSDLEIRKQLVTDLETYAGKTALANSFAYITGPAYGFTLDRLTTGWIGKVRTGEALPGIAAETSGLTYPPDTLALHVAVSGIVEKYNAGVFVAATKEAFKEEMLETGACYRYDRHYFRI